MSLEPLPRGEDDVATHLPRRGCVAGKDDDGSMLSLQRRGKATWQKEAGSKGELHRATTTCWNSRRRPSGWSLASLSRARADAQEATWQRLREHVYYSCLSPDPGSAHPVVSWRAADLEDAICRDLASLRMPSEEIADWFRRTPEAALKHRASVKKQRRGMLRKRKSELEGAQERLLNAYLRGVIDEGTFTTKSAELKAHAQGHGMAP